MAKTVVLRSIFGKDDALSRLQEHASRLVKMQRVVDRVMPPNLRGLAAVANFQKGVLTLHVPSPSLAQRLKFSHDSLKADFLAQGELVADISVRVRAIQSSSAGSSYTQEPRKIGREGKEALRTLLASIDEKSPLNSVLRRFLDRTVD